MIQALTKSTGVHRRYIWIFGLAIISWLAVVVASGTGWNPLGWQWNFGNPGAFGDSFGPLSALMASLAAISAIAAFRSQAEQYTSERELKKIDDEISASERERLAAREAAADARTEKLNFEATFFKLLEAFRSLVADIDLRTRKGATVTAHDAFQLIGTRLHEEIEYSERPHSEAWKEIAGEFKNDLNHYFRFLYHVIKFVNDSTIENKYFYVRLVRALLSESELKLIAMNCEFGEGREKFKQLIEDYALLHNLDERKIHGLDITKLYSPSAFDYTKARKRRKSSNRLR